MATEQGRQHDRNRPAENHGHAGHPAGGDGTCGHGHAHSHDHAYAHSHAHAGHDHEGGHAALRAALTRNQSLVLGVLDEAATPVSAYAILDTLRAEGLKAPLQIYRALDKLIESGLAHRLESMNAFVSCRHPGHEEASRAAFLICQGCGRVVEAEGDGLAAALARMAAEAGFTVEHAAIEIRGRCGACAAG